MPEKFLLVPGTLLSIAGEGEELYVCTKAVEFWYDMRQCVYRRVRGDYEYIDSLPDLRSIRQEWEVSFDSHIQMEILSRWRVSFRHRDMVYVKEQ